MKFIWTLLPWMAIGTVLAQRQTYKAAVVEYAPKRDSASTPLEVIKENIQEYVKIIEEASQKSADIIVFPEDGLTTLEVSDKIKDHLDSYSVEVPDPQLKYSPCSNRSVNTFLVDLSCAAKQNSLYVVVNLLEKEQRNNSNITFHNTNVVFDRNGTIIARFRKVNLFLEPNFIPGKEVVSFKTDFNVTFGIFICFDILFEKPAIEVLKNNEVTDIIYSTAWFSKSPFLSSLTAQTGYAVGNGINLLASGYNNPENGNGGSGIYLANGTVAKSFISGIATTKLIVQDVPIIKKRLAPNDCKNPVHVKAGDNIIDSDISKFKIERILKNYTLEPISKKEISWGSFSCKFNITFERSNITNNDTYEYKLALFYGVEKYGERTAGVRTCAVVACYNSTCGSIVKGVKTRQVKYLSISSTFIKKGDEFIEPSSATTNLNPAFDYTFCAEESNNRVTVTIVSSKPQESLLSMGFYSRVFDLDGQAVGPIDEGGSSSQHIILYVGVPLVLIILLVSVVVYVLYKKRKQQYAAVNK